MNRSKRIENHVCAVLHERQWFSLNGSSDILSVVACTNLNAVSETMSVTIRVFNSSGFNISPFTLHVLIKDVSSSRAVNSFSVLEDVSIASSNVWLCESCTVLLRPIKFLLPGGCVEHIFTCNIKKFAACSVFVRAFHTDLIYDEDDIFEIPTEGIGASDISKSIGGKKLNTRITQQHMLYLTEFLTTSKAKWPAVVNCEPLLIPISTLLVPYCGAVYQRNLSSLQYSQFDVAYAGIFNMDAIKFISVTCLLFM